MPRGDRPDRLGVAGLIAAAAGLGCLLLVTVLGPSVLEPALPGGAGQPPYSMVAHPSPYLVIALTAAGIAVATAGLGLCLFAVRRGWRTSPRALLVAGGIAMVAFAVMPPIGSGDHLNYAAYGRMAVTGSDPYATSARDLPADPVTRAVQDWRDTPTVYGPIATAQEAFASLIGGRSVRLTVFVMSVTNAIAFLAVGLLLYRAARGDPGRELRAVLCWTANPLLLFELLGGAHNDVLAIALALAGLVVFALPDVPWSRPGGGHRFGGCLLVGMLIGAGAAVKINVAILGAGPAWILLRDLRPGRGPRTAAVRLLALVGGAGAVTGLAYLTAGPHSLDQLRRASKSVSLAVPWHLFAGPGGGLLWTMPRQAIQVAAVLLTVVLAALLLRALPVGAARPGDEVFRVSAAVALAWLFAAPYALPWYDAVGWAMIALLPWSRFDWLVLARTAALALAYLPARDPKTAGLPADLGWLVTVVRSQVMPWASMLILMALIALAARRSRPVPAPVRSPRAPTGSPPRGQAPGSPRRSR